MKSGADGTSVVGGKRKRNEDVGGVTANAMPSFASLGLSEPLVKQITAPLCDRGLSLVTPTRVQCASIPPILRGRDVLVRSETGSGKTLAFVLPIVQGLINAAPRLSRMDGLRAIIMSPTRELCLQISEVLSATMHPFHWLVSGLVVGGEKKKSEKARLRKGLNILVATPGRLLDHLCRTAAFTSHLKLCAKSSSKKLHWLVLDEADRLLDAGFGKQIVQIMDQLTEIVPESAGRMQTVLVSATLSGEIKSFADKMLHDPVEVRVDGGEADLAAEGPPRDLPHGSVEAEYSTPAQLKQHFLVVECKLRAVTLAAFVRKQMIASQGAARLVVFCSCRASVEFIQLALSTLEWPPSPRRPAAKAGIDDTTALAVEQQAERRKRQGFGSRWWMLHGSVPQESRRRTVREFSRCSGGCVLVCTDVAARGLDLPSIDWIIQYDTPAETSEYVHRVGRAARLGRKGNAVVFLQPSEVAYVDLLGKSGLVITELSLRSVLQSLLHGLPKPKRQKRMHGKSRRRADMDALNPENAAAKLQIKLEDLVNGDPTPGGKEQRAEVKAAADAREAMGKKSLAKLARDGYLSFLRAYAVHTKETRHIFVLKTLHLGHVARSFGLRELPAKITSEAKVDKHKRRERKEHFRSMHAFKKAASRASDAKRYDSAVRGISEFS